MVTCLIQYFKRRPEAETSQQVSDYWYKLLPVVRGRFSQAEQR